ncbi:uncharacterized protein TNCV_1560491 [Trichonephila clavipes]|nr:uncharacterized protein TNCV_1560491 [Trichonephila clavipes]
MGRRDKLAERARRNAEKPRKDKEQDDERMDEMSHRVEDLEKMLLACGKPSFCLLLKYLYLPHQSNVWTEEIKACQLVASLRGEAAEVLQTLPDTERLNVDSLYNALDLQLAKKYSKDYARLQMKRRL